MHKRRWLPLWPLALLVVAVAVTVSVIGSPVYEVMKDLVITALQVVGVVVALRAGLQDGTPSNERRPWLFLTGHWVLAAATSVAFMVAFSGGPAQPPKSGALLVGAILWVAQVAPMLACVLTVPVRPMDRGERVRFALDMAAVCGSGFIALWFLVLAPAIGSSLNSTRIITIVQPLLHLIVVFAVCAVMMRGGVTSVRHPLSFLLLGNVGLLINVVFVGDMLTRSPTAVDLPVADIVVQIASVMMIMAAVIQRRRVGRDALSGGAFSRKPTALPYLALGIGYSLLIAAAITEDANPWVGLIAGASLMTGAVAGRQFLAARANHNFVIRDTLTGVGSRVAVYDHLDRAVNRSRSNGRPVAVLLIDLDGFKPVNDRLGHAAGDELLVAFAGLLRGSVRFGDAIGRLGGDEFVIVLSDVTDAATALRIAGSIVSACQTPFTVAGTEVTIGASIGVSLTGPDGPIDAQKLLHQADVAMYQIKRRRGRDHVLLYDLGMELNPQAVTEPAAMPGLHTAELAELDRLRCRVAELETKGAGRVTTAVGPDRR